MPPEHALMNTIKKSAPLIVSIVEEMVFIYDGVDPKKKLRV